MNPNATLRGIVIAVGSLLLVAGVAVATGGSRVGASDASPSPSTAVATFGASVEASPSSSPDATSSPAASQDDVSSSPESSPSATEANAGASFSPGASPSASADDDDGDDDDNSGPGNGDDGDDDDNSGPGNGDDDDDDNSGPGNGDDDSGPTTTDRSTCQSECGRHGTMKAWTTAPSSMPFEPAIGTPSGASSSWRRARCIGPVFASSAGLTTPRT